MKDDKKIKILLIDDDRFLLDMYLMKFQKSEFDVDIETCSSCSEALDKIRNDNIYDIVIIDIIMPGIDGIEFMKTVRGEKLATSTTFIMLTNQPDASLQTKELGIDGYIVKAMTIPSEVVEKVMDIYKNKKHVI